MKNNLPLIIIILIIQNWKNIKVEAFIKIIILQIKSKIIIIMKTNYLITWMQLINKNLKIIIIISTLVYNNKLLLIVCALRS